jgi:hypothetical protein
VQSSKGWEQEQGKKPTSQRHCSQPAEIGRGIKSGNRSVVTSQAPKRAASTQQISGKIQRLRSRVGWQAYLLKQGRWWIPELISGTEGSIQNWIAHLTRRGAEQTGLWLKGNPVATWLKQLWTPSTSWQSYLTSKFQLILCTKEPNTTHSQSPYQSFLLCANTRIGHLRKNSRIFTKRLNFLWLLNLVLFIMFLFFIFIL